MAANDTDGARTDTPPGRGVNVALWVAQGLLALVFAGAGLTKLAGLEVHVEMFDEIGLGQWFRYLTGALEVAGAVGLLIPRLNALAAAGLAVVMAGAVFTDIVVLGSNPVAALVLLLLTAIVAWARRGQGAGLLRPVAQG